MAQLAERPEDLGARQVLADLLLSSPDPSEAARGELISLAIRRLSSPWKRTLDRRARELHAQHGPALLGPLHGPPPGSLHWECEWELGFVRAVRLQQHVYGDPAREVAWVLAALPGLPAMGLLQELHVALALGEEQAAQLQHILDTLRGSRLPLRKLVLRGFAEPWGAPFAPESRADATGLLSAFPWLEHLELEGAEVVYGELSSARLRTCRLLGDLRRDQLEQISRADWPSLESLALGASEDVDTCDALHPLLEGTLFPRLAHLGFELYGAAGSWRSLWARVLEAPVLKRLEVLEVSPVEASDLGLFVAARPRLAHLQRLGMRLTVIVDPVPPELKGLCRWVDLGETRLERGEVFCEVQLEEPLVFLRHGTLGSSGVQRLRSREGWRDFHLAVEELRQEGYLARTPRRGRKDEVPRDELWAAVRARPDDPAALLAWADWNRAWGIPRAELIRLQCAPEDAPGRLLREQQLLEEEAETLLGPLAEHLRPDCSPHLVLQWRYGYVRSARIEALPGDPDPLSVAELVELLLRHPSGRLLEDLEVVLVAPGSREALQRVLAGRHPLRVRISGG
jgi:uncharacterized protein (TIGR02996 family)